MKYPYRVIIRFADREKHPTCDKLKTIFKINKFLNDETSGEYTKYNIMENISTDYITSREFMGVEVAFTDNRDAVHFKLGFISDGEEVRSNIYGQGEA